MHAVEPDCAPARLVPDPRASSDRSGVVRSPTRLAAVADLHLPGHAGDPDLDAVVETLAAALWVPKAVVNVVTPDLQTYPSEIGVGVPCTYVPDGLSFCAEVVETGRALLIEDARAHPTYVDNPLVQQGAIAAYAGFPLVHRGEVIGAVSVFDDQPRSFTERELRVLAAQARLAATVLTLRWTATHDPLTGLANRRRLAERVAALPPGPVALLFVDVDDFKAVNDTHGHDHGDAVLCALAALLRESVAGTEGLAVRWGGDEFLVLLPGATPAAATRAAQDLVQAVRRHPALTCSVTVGLSSAPETVPWDALVAAAGAATGSGKREGKDRVVHEAPARRHRDSDGA
ncbi:MAG: Signaling protein ykoW [Frankiales bacterium]|nr:Signaling protein ykoW [Frankiales bacterium]